MHSVSNFCIVASKAFYILQILDDRCLKIIEIQWYIEIRNLEKICKDMQNIFPNLSWLVKITKLSIYSFKLMCETSSFDQIIFKGQPNFLRISRSHSNTNSSLKILKYKERLSHMLRIFLTHAINLGCTWILILSSTFP